MITKVQDTYSDLVALNEFILPYEYLIVKDDNMIESLVKQTMTNLLRSLFRMNNELMLIKEYLDTQVDRKRAAFKLYVQR